MISGVNDAQPLLALLTTIRNHVRGLRSLMVIGEGNAEAIPLRGSGFDQRSHRLSAGILFGFGMLGS
jgi:hypothetical protein